MTTETEAGFRGTVISPGDAELTRVESAYGPEKYARLRRITKEWDPDNVFCHDQNLPPAD